MIRAVIFDCFGVLTSEGLLQFFDEYFSDDDNRRQELSDVLRGMNTGLIDRDEALNRFAELAGVETYVVKTALANNKPDEKLFDFIKNKLKPSYKIGILSNAGANRIVELFGSEKATLFDNIVLSFQVGMAKPDTAIYELSAQNLGVTTEECIFIDDQAYYCEAAEVAGMKAVNHKQTSETIRRVTELIDA